MQFSWVLFYYNVHQRFEWTFYVHKHLSYLFFYKLDDDKKCYGEGEESECISYKFVWDVMHFIEKKCRDCKSDYIDDRELKLSAFQTPFPPI